MTDLIQPEDYKYVIEKPDPKFSPERNKAVIQETIKNTEKFFKEIADKIDDEGMNRIDILSSYGRYRCNRGEKNFKDYAGKKLWGQLIGEKILNRISVS